MGGGDTLNQGTCETDHGWSGHAMLLPKNVRCLYWNAQKTQVLLYKCCEVLKLLWILAEEKTVCIASWIVNTPQHLFKKQYVIRLP